MKITKNYLRDLIRESLEEVKNPIRKSFLKAYGPEGEFDNPSMDPRNLSPEIDLMNVSGMPEQEYESYEKMHDSFMKIPAVMAMWEKFVARNKQKMKK